jgi:hypothetical protein
MSHQENVNIIEGALHKWGDIVLDVVPFRKNFAFIEA